MKALLLMLALSSSAADLAPPPITNRPVKAMVKLGWQPVKDAAKYRVYSGPEPRFYTNVVNTTGPQTNAVVTNLAPRFTYYFAVTTIDQLGRESVYSEEVNNAPLTNTVVTLWTRTATDLNGPWTRVPIWSATNPPGLKRFWSGLEVTKEMK